MMIDDVLKRHRRIFDGSEKSLEVKEARVVESRPLPSAQSFAQKVQTLEKLETQKPLKFSFGRLEAPAEYNYPVVGEVETVEKENEVSLLEQTQEAMMFEKRKQPQMASGVE